MFGYVKSQNGGKGISLPPIPSVAMETTLPLGIQAEADYILIPAAFTLK